MFNQICINEEMLPKYTYFKLRDPAAHKYNSTFKYKRDFVKRQITLSKNDISTLNLENATQYNSTNAHSYKVVMYIEKLHHFCNTTSPEDDPKLGRMYLGNN